ncbi:MAG: hypothetical protein ACI4RQ_07290 [Methanobrevibacter wolinii]
MFGGYIIKEINRKLILFFSCFLIILFISSVSAVDSNSTDSLDNQDLSVSQDNNDLSISENSINTSNNKNQVSILKSSGHKSFTDLQNLIDSNKNGTIDLNSDYIYNDNDNKNGILIINKSIIINGNNHIINANNHYIVFNVSLSTVKLNNIHLTNGYEDKNTIEGLVEINKSNATFINSSFSNTKGRIFYSYNSNFTLNKCKVINISQAYLDNLNNQFSCLALFSSHSNISINNTLFKDIGEGIYSGSIFSNYDNFTIDNSNFTNSSSIDKGGALYIIAGDAVISNCNFDNCSSRKGGGAIITNKERNIIIKNSRFNNNYLNSDSPRYSFVGKGGACDFGDSNVTVMDSKFNNNSANLGGAIFFENKNVYNNNVLNIKDCDFNNNNTIYGGSIYCLYNYLTNVNNSKFNNGISYFGGAITCAGGNLTVNNSGFKNGKSKFGGAIVTDKNLTIANSKFSNNYANVGNDIARFNSTFNLINTSANIYTFDNLLHTTGDNYRNVSINDTSNGFCSEAVIHQPHNGQEYFVYDTSIFYNKLNNKPISEYLKILLYKYYFKSNLTAFELQKVVWAFSEYQYENIDIYRDIIVNDKIKQVVKDVIGIYNGGFRVPDYGATDILDNGSVRVYQFASLFSPFCQNLFNFKFTYIDNVLPDFNVEKLALNKTVELNNQDSFNIVVRNNGTIMLNNITIFENNYDGLVYDSWKPINGVWIFNGDNDKPSWLLKNLGINQTAIIEVTFNTTKIGNFTNVIFVKSNETTNKTANSSIEVVKPKHHNNETVNNTNSSNNKTINNNGSNNKTINYKNNTRTNSNSVYNFTNNKGAAIAKAVGTPATGNPISIILLALILLGLIPIKRKK